MKSSLYSFILINLLNNIFLLNLQMQVVIKDFASKTVISQFRAHTSPLSALCFDPSGTLLVTASIHGNNINIFRILPSKTQNGLGADNYDWSSSHVHLYKLHRGMTSAVCIVFFYFCLCILIRILQHVLLVDYLPLVIVLFIYLLLCSILCNR